MPSRHRPKAPPPPPLSDVERFAQAVRESEEADRRARQSARDRKAEAERRKAEAVQHAADLQRARAVHQLAVEQVKEAQRSGKGAAAADVAWREAKATLIELETGERPAWAARADPTTPSAELEESESGEAADEPAEPSAADDTN
jgi:hypothetical protein